MYMGKKIKECGDFSRLRAADVFSKWLWFPGKQGFSSKIEGENPLLFICAKRKFFLGTSPVCK